MSASASTAEPIAIHTTSLGETVRNLREGRDWSLTDLAEHSGVSRSWVWRIELDQCSPSLDILRRLAAAFDVSVSELLGS